MRSLWLTDTKRPGFPTLKNNIKTDVLIIGGGIAGILTAHFLRQAGVSCVLVERDRICGGTTGHTTAKITYQHGLIYHKLLKRFGAERTALYLEANRMAAERYRELCRSIDCGYEIRSNYVYSIDDRRKLENEMDALSVIGYRARFCEMLPLPINTAGAVCFEAQAQFHPLQFLFTIARGLTIYEHTFVRELSGTTAVTDEGSVHADKVVVTTHFPFLNTHGSYFLKLYQHRSYVIALAHAQQVDGMYVDDNKTGYSFRNYKDLLLLGGGAHRTGKSGGSWGELRDFAERHYPDSQERYFWAAQDCISLDDIPYIGPYSKHTPGLYTACGFHKWGMTGAMLSALLLCDMIRGIPNDLTPVFSPSRSILRPRLFTNILESAVHLLTPSPKRCPHLGCALKWNPCEHSWDCACHGSRFSSDGTLLDNPANGDLKNP